MSSPEQCVSFKESELLDMDSVAKLVLGATTKYCPLDPLPTSIVKECLDELLPVLTAIINSSLSSEFFLMNGRML